MYLCILQKNIYKKRQDNVQFCLLLLLHRLLTFSFAISLVDFCIEVWQFRFVCVCLCISCLAADVQMCSVHIVHIAVCINNKCSLITMYWREKGDTIQRFNRFRLHQPFSLAAMAKKCSWWAAEKSKIVVIFSSSFRFNRFFLLRISPVVAGLCF